MKKGGDRIGAQVAGAEHGRERAERTAQVGGCTHERQRAALRAQADHNVEVREQIAVLAHRHRSYGVGVIHLKLQQQVIAVNYKRLERMYQEVDLQAHCRKRKKVPAGERRPLLRPSAANQVWSMDLVFDRTA